LTSSYIHTLEYNQMHTHTHNKSKLNL